MEEPLNTATQMPLLLFESMEQEKDRTEEVKQMVVTTINTAMKTELITPAIALEYLETMPKNRRLRQSRVDRLAAAMSNGAWIPEACGPILFNIEGHLIDGQHRLWALASVGKSIEFTVVRGVPNEGLYVIDTHRPRTLADALYIAGEVNEIPLSGAINFYAAWLNSGRMQKLSSAHAPTTAQALELFAKHPALRDSVTLGIAIRRSLKGGPGRWGCIVHILRSIDQEDADAFFDSLQTGQELNAASPILQLRKRLADDAMAVRRMQVVDYTALVFKAWNMWKSGQSTPRQLSWRGGGANPEAYPIPVG